MPLPEISRSCRTRSVRDRNRSRPLPNDHPRGVPRSICRPACIAYARPDDTFKAPEPGVRPQNQPKAKVAVSIRAGMCLSMGGNLPFRRPDSPRLPPSSDPHDHRRTQDGPHFPEESETVHGPPPQVTCIFLIRRNAITFHIRFSLWATSQLLLGEQQRSRVKSDGSGGYFHRYGVTSSPSR